MTSTKELVNVPGLSPDEVVVIKKLGYGSLTKLRSKCALAKINSQAEKNSEKIDASVDIGEYMKWLVVFGVKSASFFVGCVSIVDRAKVIDGDKISAETGEYLYKEIETFNGFTADTENKKKN